MSNGYGFGGEEIKQESSWRYPLGIFMATLVLCAIFLYYYVGPSVDDFSGNTPSPAITEEPVRVERSDGIVTANAMEVTGKGKRIIFKGDARMTLQDNSHSR